MAEPFTFQVLRELTPDLAGPERMEVFYGLPTVLQRQAWDVLAEQARWRSDCEHRDFG